MMIDRIHNAMVNGLGSTAAGRKALESKRNSEKKSAVTSNVESIIARALESGNVDPQLIAKARMLIETDKLETQENIEAAVKKILKYGF